MAGLRRESEDYILHYIEAIAGATNRKLYEEKFKNLDDEAFERMIEGLENGTVHLSVIAPNFSKDTRLSVENNFKVADELGHNFFQRIRIPARNGLPSYLTPIPYLIMDLPERRQAQLLEKKISIPEHNNSVDDLTGQPTGESKGSKISYPETQVMAALGLDECLLEFLKYRGGDEKGLVAMNTMIDRSGGVSMKAIEPFSGGVKSTQTLKSYLGGMQLRATGI